MSGYCGRRHRLLIQNGQDITLLLTLLKMWTQKGSFSGLNLKNYKMRGNSSLRFTWASMISSWKDLRSGSAPLDGGRGTWKINNWEGAALSFSLLLHFSVSRDCRGQNRGTRLGLPKGGSKSKNKDNVQKTPLSSHWALELYIGWGQIVFEVKTTEIYLGRKVCVPSNVALWVRNRTKCVEAW